MKSVSLCLALSAVSAISWGAEPLYVPPADYAYAQPVVPQGQPIPEFQLGAPAPGFGGHLPAVPMTPGTVEPLPQMLPSYPSAGPVISGPVIGGPIISGPVVGGKLVSLYPNVKVRSPHRKWPGGVSEVVQIPNPVPRSGNCEPVYVQICVPPGCQPTVSYGPRGQRVTYAFGGYRVVVTSLRGVVTVDYDRKI
ncbi:MAG: hypothetical protein ACK5Q5_10495 [Planctomycetaceae bacterium]